MVAAQQGQRDAVTILLQRKASIDNVNKEGSTALFEAVTNGHGNVVVLLVDGHADLTLKCKGETAYKVAVKLGHVSIADYLLRISRRQGGQALAQKRIDDAIVLTSQVISDTDTKSANGQDLLYRSAAYICARNQAAALADVKRGVAFGQQDGFAAAGDLLLGLGHTTDAITAFEWGLQDNPTAVACHVGLAKAKDIHDAATRSRALLTRLASNADMREWIMDKRFVAAFLAAQSGPRSGNNDNDPRVQQALAWIQGPIKPPAPATSKPPNHHPSSGPTRSTNHRAIELLAPTTLDPTASLDDLCRYIHSSLTTTTWHIMGHFYLDSSDDGPQLAVFPASHKKQTGKSFVVKLTQCDDELAFADAVDAFQGDKSAFLVDWIDWGPVTLAGVDCFALVMERGQGNCHDQLREIQSDAFLRLRCVDHVTRAVGYLHTNEYVHGDLKLENVVQFGSYKLIDFDNATRMGHTMARRCTKSYCPPELALHLRAGGPPVQASATFDLWCLGVLVLKLFVKNGVLVEFDGLDGDAILDVIAAPGFSFQASLRAADVNGRQRKYLAKCLE
ncbi:hypothetical protein As57867_000956, partial [Aphanomyces stellatus]